MNETIKDKDADKAKGQEADLDNGLDLPRERRAGGDAARQRPW